MSFCHTHKIPKSCFLPFFCSMLAAFLWTLRFFQMLFSPSLFVSRRRSLGNKPTFWGGGKLWFHSFLPEIILSHFFVPICRDTSSCWDFFFFPFCSSPLVSPQFIPLAFTAPSVAGKAGNKSGCQQLGSGSACREWGCGGGFKSSFTWGWCAGKFRHGLVIRCSKQSSGRDNTLDASFWE